ncbi:MAG: WhiB family transcriptional regulator, partial [Acidimicrobiales bacterium]
MARAKAICARCPVRAECLAFALATDQRYGIWGGTSETDRVVIARGRRRLVALGGSGPGLGSARWDGRGGGDAAMSWRPGGAAGLWPPSGGAGGNGGATPGGTGAAYGSKLARPSPN